MNGSRLPRVGVLLLMVASAASASATLVASYDFTGLTAGNSFNGSDPQLQGQDGWTDAGGGDHIDVVGTGDPRAYIGSPPGNRDDQVWRSNQPGDLINGVAAGSVGQPFAIDPTRPFSLSMYARVRGDRDAGQTLSLGLDTNNDGSLDGGTTVQFGVRGSNYFIRQTNFGATTFNAAHGLSGSNFQWVKLDVDPVTDLGTFSFSDDNVAFTPVPALTNVPLLLGNGPGIASLNGIYLRMYSPGGGGASGPTIDDINISQVPEPATAMLLALGLLGLGRRLRKP